MWPMKQELAILRPPKADIRPDPITQPGSLVAGDGVRVAHDVTVARIETLGPFCFPSDMEGERIEG